MRKLFYCSIVLLLFVFQAVPVKAIDLGFGSKVQEAAGTAGYGETTETTLAETVGIAIKAALSFVGVIFLVLMVYAGYLWFTSRGEEEPIKKAQKIIATSVIGLVIVAGAYGLTNLIVPRILEKTTGEGSDVKTVGGTKIECCSVCDTWAVTCPPKKKIDESDCKALKGKYLGLVPEEECK